MSSSTIVPASSARLHAVVHRSRSFWRLTLLRLRRDRLTLAACTFLGLIVLLALLVVPLTDRLVGVGPNDTNLDSTLQPPYLVHGLKAVLGLDETTAAKLLEISGGLPHWLGTDSLGRDQMVRLLYGARVSMLVAFCAAVIGFVLGIALGMAAGFFGGLVDSLAWWLISTFSSVPTLFVLILITAVFKPNAITLTLFLGFFGWIGPARFMRGQILQLRELDYTVAARALGATQLRIMWNHLLPNTLPLMIVLITLEIGTLILVESVLSFLGFGIQPPQATWGNMLANSQNFLFLQDEATGAFVAWHLIFPPGILIFLTVLSLFLLGDGLRDAMDPQLRIVR